MVRVRLIPRADARAAWSGRAHPQDPGWGERWVQPFVGGRVALAARMFRTLEIPIDCLMEVID